MKKSKCLKTAAAFCAALCLIAAAFSSCSGGAGTDESSSEADTLLADNDLPLVYDASYGADITGRSYTNDAGETISLDDIKLPVININSADAARANKAIRALFDSLSTAYKAEMDGLRTSWDRASYTQDDSGGILTVVITVTSGGWGSETSKIYAWAFSKSDGSAQPVRSELTQQAEQG